MRRVSIPPCGVTVFVTDAVSQWTISSFYTPYGVTVFLQPTLNGQTDGTGDSVSIRPMA